MEQPNITLSPNPASNSFKIEHLDEDNIADYRVRLINMRGQVVKETMNLNYAGEIYIDDISNGLYVVQILKANQMIKTLKLSIVK